MLTDTHAKFEVKSLASFSAIKFQSLAAFSTTNARKTGQSITIGKTAKESKRLQSRVKTSRQSFETDSANLSFFIQIICDCTSYGISCLSPKAKKKKENSV